MGVRIESIEWRPNRQPESNANGGGIWCVTYFVEDGGRTTRYYSGFKVRDAMEAYTRFMREGAAQ